MNERPLGVHKVEFVVQPSPGLINCCCVGQATNGPHNLGEVPSRDHSWWLVVDANLETCWTPVHELDSPRGLDLRNSCIDILWNHVPPVQEADRHVLPFPWITLDHLALDLKACLGDLGDWHHFMIGPIQRDDRTVCGQGIMDPWIRNQISLELIEVHIQGSIKSKTCCDRRNDLGNQPVEIGVRRPGNVKIGSTNVINGLVVH